MKAVRYATADGEARLGRLDGDTVVDAGSAPSEGFVPSDDGWDHIATASGKPGRWPASASSTRPSPGT